MMLVIMRMRMMRMMMVVMRSSIMMIERSIHMRRYMIMMM